MAKPDDFFTYKILVMNAKRMHCFNVKKIRESKTAIMQIESRLLMFVAPSGE